MKALIFTVLLAAAGVAAGAGMYKWVDEKGRIQYSDTPPPPSAKSVERRNIGGGTIQTSSLPYGVQLAVKNFPVTLWANNCGEVCDQARAHLGRRGVPYTEKDPQADPEGFKKASGGDMGVPLLFVGNTRLKGYLESAWDSELDVAGYPKTASVPAKPAASAGTKVETNAPRPAADGYPAPAQ